MADLPGDVEFKLLEVSGELTPEICRSFELFCVRYRELRANMVDLRGLKATFSMHLTKNKGQITAKSPFEKRNWIDAHLLPNNLFNRSAYFQFEMYIVPVRPSD